jgi:hypothetical protein
MGLVSLPSQSSSGLGSLLDLEAHCHSSQNLGSWAGWDFGSGRCKQCLPSSPLLPACGVAQPASACPGGQLHTVRDEVTGETLAWCEGLFF